MKKRHLVANILLGDGVLLIILGFLHFLSTPVVHDWLERQLTIQTLRSIPMQFFLNHITIGMLLIPFGVSTLYSAAGIRVGHRWARAIALTNGLAVLLIPLFVLLIMGTQYFDTPFFFYACVATTAIGLSMLLPLIWLGGDHGPDDKSLHHRYPS
jgi:hypothetical protein